MVIRTLEKTPEEILKQQIASLELQLKSSVKKAKIARDLMKTELESIIEANKIEAENKREIINKLLTNHIHAGLETSGRLEPEFLKAKSLESATIIVGNGATGSFISDVNLKTITVVSGIITAITTN